MKVFYENVKYTMLMEKKMQLYAYQSGRTEFINLSYTEMLETLQKIKDSVFKHNTNGLFVNTFEFKVLE